MDKDLFSSNEKKVELKKDVRQVQMSIEEALDFTNKKKS